MAFRELNFAVFGVSVEGRVLDKQAVIDAAYLTRSHTERRDRWCFPDAVWMRIKALLSMCGVLCRIARYAQPMVRREQ